MNPELLNASKYLDVLQLGRFIELVSQLLEKGYGEANFRVLIRKGKVVGVHLTSTETISIDNKDVI